LQFDIVLLQSVQGKLCLVVDVNLEWLFQARESALMLHIALGRRRRTFCINFLQVTRISFDRVALNIITCLFPEMARKISCTSRRMSECSFQVLYASGKVV
jgi:hypothetical protein